MCVCGRGSLEGWLIKTLLLFTGETKREAIATVGRAAARMDVEKCTRDLRETVRELEAALATTRETVQQLKGALESREDEIAGLRQMLTRTKKERDELRMQNAELINRLAVIGRKQSTSSSPRQSR